MRHGTKGSTQLVCAVALGLGLALSSAPASAASISFTGMEVTENGTGFGNVLNLLSLQPGMNATMEYGSVLWNGASDVLSGDAKNTSDTQSAQALLDNDFDELVFGLIFNINEVNGGGNDNVLLDDFSLVFMDASGMTLFEALYDAPLDGLLLDEVDGGSGNSGWLFRVELTQAESGLFFGSPDNRIGMVVEEGNAIDLVSDGPDNFFLTNLTGEVPEPGGLLLGAVGMLGLAFYGRPRRA